MEIPLWLYIASILLSPVSALVGVWLANSWSKEREQESHQRQLERDREIHRHARSMWQLELRRNTYTHFLGKCEEMTLNLESKSFDALEALTWHELLLVASGPVNAAYRKFNKALAEDLKTIRGGGECEGKSGKALEVLAGAMAADIRLAARGVDTNEVPASAIDDLS